MVQIYFYNHSYYLLLIITQCSFVIYSFCRFETLAMPFNFQATIFSAKMQYSRPCFLVGHNMIMMNDNDGHDNDLKFLLGDTFNVAKRRKTKRSRRAKGKNACTAL